MAKEKVIDIEELIQDDHNFNKGTDKGKELIEKSFRELGAGRSVLVDKDNRLIGGNKAQIGALAAGIKKARIVESDGTELIVVKRTDISLDTEKGRKMALADNATQEANLSWDKEELEKAKEAFGVAPTDWGVELPSGGGIPLELQDEDLIPDKLDNIQGEDRTEMQRVIICFYPNQEHRLRALLGIDKLEKVVYSLNELIDKE